MKYVISDVMTITKRQLLQLARIPEVLVFSTIQPVMFVLLFRFVFGVTKTFQERFEVPLFFFKAVQCFGLVGVKSCVARR